MENGFGKFGSLPRSALLTVPAGLLLTIGLRESSPAPIWAASILIAVRAVAGLAGVRASVTPRFVLRGPLTRWLLSVVGGAILLVFGLSLAAGVKAGFAAWSWAAAVAVGMLFTVATWWVTEVVMVSASFHEPWPVLKTHWRDQSQSLLKRFRRLPSSLWAALPTAHRVVRERIDGWRRS